MNTMPEATLKALADHGDIGETMPADAHNSDEVLAKFAKAGIDIDASGPNFWTKGPNHSSSPGTI